MKIFLSFVIDSALDIFPLSLTHPGLYPLAYLKPPLVCNFLIQLLACFPRHIYRFKDALKVLMSGIRLPIMLLILISLLKSRQVYVSLIHSEKCAGLKILEYFSAHSWQKEWPQSRTRAGLSKISRQIGHFKRSRMYFMRGLGSGLCLGPRGVVIVELGQRLGFFGD